MEKKMIAYLQHQMNEFKKLEKMLGDEDERTISAMEQMIGAKELVEAVIEKPVNLQIDGQVTIGLF
jgi:hypothetical protein